MFEKHYLQLTDRSIMKKLNYFLLIAMLLNFTNLLSVKKINHKLSHQLLYITFFVFKADNKIDDLVDINSLINYPFPRPLNKFISELI